MKDHTIDPGRGSLLSIPLSVVLLGGAIVPHWLLWRENPLIAMVLSMEAAGWVGGALALVILVVGAFVHEAIHGYSWRIAARLRATDIEYGVLWQVLMPYAHLKRPITARAYRIGGMMPGLLLGAVPSVAGVLTGSAVVTGWGAVFLGLASGDLLVLLTLRGVPADVLVRDHPARLGVELVEPGSDPAEAEANDIER